MLSWVVTVGANGVKVVAPIQVVVRDDRLGDGEPHLLRRIAERKNELKSGTESAVELWSEFLESTRRAFWAERDEPNDGRCGHVE